MVLVIEPRADEWLHKFEVIDVFKETGNEVLGLPHHIKVIPNHARIFFYFGLFAHLRHVHQAEVLHFAVIRHPRRADDAILDFEGLAQGFKILHDRFVKCLKLFGGEKVCPCRHLVAIVWVVGEWIHAE